MTCHERTRVKNALSRRNTLECTRHREKTPVGIKDVSKNRLQNITCSERTHEITVVGCTLTSASVIHLGMPRVCVFFSNVPNLQRGGKSVVVVRVVRWRNISRITARLLCLLISTPGRLILRIELNSPLELCPFRQGCDDECQAPCPGGGYH